MYKCIYTLLQNGGYQSVELYIYKYTVFGGLKRVLEGTGEAERGLIARYGGIYTPNNQFARVPIRKCIFVYMHLYNYTIERGVPPKRVILGILGVTGKKVYILLLTLGSPYIRQDREGTNAKTPPKRAFVVRRA